MLCVVSEYEGLVTFTEVNTEYDTLERRTVASGGSGVEWQNIMIGKVCAIENKVHDIQNNHARHYQEVLKKLEKMDNNLKRIAVMPAQQVRPQRVDGRGGSSNESKVHHPANLCHCPKNLYVLWAEYESGVGGNKPAKCLTRQRGTKFVLSTVAGRLSRMKLKHWFRGASQVMWLLIGFILSVEAPTLK